MRRLPFRLLLLACLAIAHAAPSAQGGKPVRIIVPFPPGGGSDILARIVAPKLSDALKQPVVVENRPGAGGTVGADAVAKSAPDGLTLLVAEASVLTISPQLLPTLPYATRDLAPVANLALFPHVLVVPAASRVQSVQQLVAEDRAQPGRFTIGSAGNGTTPHLTAELFKAAAGLRLVHVPYKGSGPAIADTVGAQVDMIFTGLPTVTALMKGGKLRAIGVTSAARLRDLPQVPTIAEAGFASVESYISQGLFAPAATPRELVVRLHAEVSRALRQPDSLVRLAQLGIEPVDQTADQYAAWIRQQADQWATVIRQAGVKAE